MISKWDRFSLIFWASTMNDGIVLKEIDSGVEHVINLPCVIGRGKDADLALADQTVSHRHALIDISADQIWIKDLSSANSTLVNDLKVTEKTNLRPGDTIQFGQSRFLKPTQHKQEIEETQIIHTLARSAELPLDFKRLELIYAITAELPEGHDVKDLGENIFALFKGYFKQDRAYIALFQEDGDLQPLCCAPLSQPIPLSRSIVNRIFTNGESFVLTDALTNGSFKEQESIIAMNIRSAICAPLTYHNQIYGFIYLDRNIAYAYNQQDLELFRSIAAIIAPLIENARLWSELQDKYANTVETLRKTQARLIDTERIAAYSRVAQAMAH
jgi:GAF domain-containing protein